MGHVSIVGEGSFAIVIGPFRSASNKNYYVLKVYKKPLKPKQDLTPVHNKQLLYNRLHKQSRHHSILFPLSTVVVKGKDLLSYLPVDPAKLYLVEKQEYGGISMEKFFNNPSFSFTMKEFLQIWKSIPPLLEDCYHVLFDNNLLITDVKMENMVLSDTHQLKLIDVDITPNQVNIARIITPYIRELPPQFFSHEWWGASFHDSRKYMLRLYKDNYHKEKKNMMKILEFIHSRKDPSSFIQPGKLMPQDNRFQRFFFVLYPIFIMMVLLIVDHKVQVHTDHDKFMLKKIMSFCLEILQKRGHFSKKLNYSSFQHFLWKIKTLLNKQTK